MNKKMAGKKRTSRKSAKSLNPRQSAIQTMSGYKGFTHPTLGYIPQGWEVLSFSKLFDFLPTHSLFREDLSFEPPDNGIFNIHYGDIHATFKQQILDFEKHISDVPVILDKNLTIGDTSFLKDGDLIIADASEDYEGVGECIEVAGIRKRKVVSGLHTIAARSINGKTVPGFRAYLLKNPLVFKNLKKLATGSKVYGISKTNIAQLELVVPPTDAQEKFGKIFSTWDKAIEKTEQLIAKKQQLKKGLMQKLLTGKVRFKEFVKSKKMKMTKLGLAPEDWQVMKGEDISVKITKGSSPNWQGFQYQNDGVLFVTSENVRDGFLDLKNPKFLPKEFNDKLKNSSLKVGDILINIVGASIGRSCIFDQHLIANINQAVCVFRPKENVSVEMLSAYLQSPISVRKLLDTQSDSARPNLTLEDIRNFLFPIPNIDEQRKIGRVSAKLDKEVAVLNEVLAMLTRQKKGLMQNLLTGKLRVKTK